MNGMNADQAGPKFGPPLHSVDHGFIGNRPHYSLNVDRHAAIAASSQTVTRQILRKMVNQTC